MEEHLTGMQENLASIPSLKKYAYIYEKIVVSKKKNIMYQIKQKFKSKIFCSLAYYIMNIQLMLALFVFHTFNPHIKCFSKLYNFAKYSFCGQY